MAGGVNKYWFSMGERRERACPKCGAEKDLKAGVVLVCPHCDHVERVRTRGKEKPLE